MRGLLFLLAGGGILVPLVLALWIWRRRALWRSRLENESCRLCGTPFGEALYDVLGPPTRQELERLDAFQRRYARYRVLCHECQGVNLVADNGCPMRAYPVVD